MTPDSPMAHAELVDLETLARAMRKSRLGACGGKWENLTDATKEDWLTSAEALRRFLSKAGVVVVSKRAVQ